MLGALQRLVRSGDVVYDVGANIGLYSRFLVQVFDAGQVYAFEPMQENQELFEENCRLGGCSSRVKVLSLGVSNEDGVCEFQVDDLTSNSGTLDAVTGGKPSQSRSQYGLAPLKIQIKTARLDTIVKDGSLPKPDVIKLDIEGAEALALEGAREMLLEHKPHLAIELHGPVVGKRVLPILWDLGYTTFGELARGKDEKKEYGEVRTSDLKYVTDKYSLHFIAASHDPSRLAQPIEEYSEAAEQLVPASVARVGS